MAGTAVEQVQGSGFDLTRAPWRQWDQQMVDLCKATVLPSATDDAEVYFCLAVADSLGLSPFAQEIFFIPGKARDGGPRTVKPYVGREGLVKKANDRDYYFEADYVCEQDKFRMARAKDGTRSVTHSYGKREERGEVVGAYAFLWSRDPAVKPAFFYADLSEYLPDLNDEKMAKSPWSDSNQRSSMILKCAMIGAGRQRLNLSGVMIDAEVDRVLQQERGTGSGTAAAPEMTFPWETISDEMVRARLRDAVEAAQKRDREAWPAAKCQMAFTGRSIEDLTRLAEQIEQENIEAEPVSEVVADAEVVTPEMEAVDELRRRETQLATDLGFAQNADQEASIRAELDQVRVRIRQLGGEAPGQESLGLDG